MEQLPVNQILKKAAEKSGFKRVRYSESQIPTTIQNCVVFVFFGDMRSTAILSSLLLKRYKEEAKGSKYFILCSWPGYEGLFPWVDEYWEVKEDSNLRSLYNQAIEFENKSETVNGYHRVLNTFFEEVVDYSNIKDFYDRGLKQQFFDRFKNIKCYLPSVPSSAMLGNDFNRRLGQSPKPVLLYPCMYFQNWNNGKLEPLIVSKSFWVALVERLLVEGFQPVVYQNYYTHDLSTVFVDKCLYVNSPQISSVLSAMRASGVVLDLFSGISRLAIAARTPFLVCEERLKFNTLKEYEIDDLCGKQIPKSYFYVFPSISDEINQMHWNNSLFDGIIVKLNALANCDKNDLPSPVEVSGLVPYASVRQIKANKFGTRFIKIPKC